LVVGGSRALIKAVHQGACGLKGTEVVTCAVREAPTRAAELRPFALVMSEDIYAFDSKEFDALARDVRAEIVTLTSGRAAPGRSRSKRPSKRPAKRSQG
jgi:hypothetical protein